MRINEQNITFTKSVDFNLIMFHKEITVGSLNIIFKIDLAKL